MPFRDSLTLASADLLPIRATGGVSPSMTLGTMSTRPALLLKLTDSHGCSGWGEIWANFPPRANQHKAHIVQDVVLPHLLDVSFTDPAEIISHLRNKLGTYFLHVGQEHVFEHILAGLDVALWDLALRNAGVSFAEHIGVNHASASTYASSINPGDIDTLVTLHASKGQTHFKLKVGFGTDQDREFVKQAFDACPSGSRIMIDSNQKWTADEAHKALSAFEAFNPLFAEEPVRADAPAHEWETLASATSIALAAGENIYGIDNFQRMANAGVRYLQPDVAKWGGISGALELAAALPDGASLWPHFMGTAVGQMAALSVAAAVGDNSICEMDVNRNDLRTELCGDVLDIRNGQVALHHEPGVVSPPDASCLARFAD